MNNNYINKNIKLGDSYSITREITADNVEKFAELSGDYNPVHINEEEAKKSIFGRRIAHGMLCGSLISTVIGMYLPGPGSIYMDQSFKFVAPVFLGDTITAKVVVADIIDDKAILTTTVTNQEGKLVLSGEAKVLMPS